jgi:hypothetical protein
VHRGQETVFFRHLFLKGFDPRFLELGDHSAFLAYQVVMVRHEIALVPLEPVPEIELFRIAESCEKFHRAVDGRGSDGTVPLPDGMGELFHGHMRSRPEEDLDHPCPAFASFPSDRRDFGVYALQKGFQREGKCSKMNLQFIIML